MSPELKKLLENNLEKFITLGEELGMSPLEALFTELESYDISKFEDALLKKLKKSCIIMVRKLYEFLRKISEKEIEGIFNDRKLLQDLHELFLKQKK